MKRLLLPLVFLLAAPAFAAHPGFRGNFADFPTCDSTTDGRYATSINATNSATCDGGGSATAPCFCDGSSWQPFQDGTGSGSPGGSVTQVQFHDTTFGGDAGFVYNKTTDSVTISGAAPVFTVEDTNTPVFMILRNDVATPAADVGTGSLLFQGNDSGGTATSYAGVRGFVTDDTDTSEDGYLKIDVQVAGTPTDIVQVDGTGLTVTGTVTGDNVISKVGTPADDQVGVWTGDGTLEGSAGFTLDATDLTLSSRAFNVESDQPAIILTPTGIPDDASIYFSDGIANEWVLHGDADGLYVEDAVGPVKVVTIQDGAPVDSLVIAATTGNISVTGTVDGVDLANHSGRHDENGADELLGEGLGTACTINQILKSDGAGGLDCAADADSGGAPAFSAITGSTNTTAAMVVGTGGTLDVSGSGTIAATDTAGLAATGDVTLDDGAGDSPKLILDLATANEPFSLYGDDSANEMRVEVTSASTRGVVFDNIGAGTAQVVIDGIEDGLAVEPLFVLRGIDPVSANVCVSGWGPGTQLGEFGLWQDDASGGTTHGGGSGNCGVGDQQITWKFQEDGSHNSAGEVFGGPWMRGYGQDSRTDAVMGPNKDQKTTGFGADTGQLNVHVGTSGSGTEPWAWLASQYGMTGYAWKVRKATADPTSAAPANFAVSWWDDTNLMFEYVGDIDTTPYRIIADRHFSGDATVSSAGVVTVADDSHDHTDKLPLAGGTMTGELVADDLGIEFTPGDTLTDCSTFSATGGGIFFDDSEGIFKKCQDNVLTDMDTTGGGLSLSGVTDGNLLYDNSDALGGISQFTYDGTNLSLTPTSGDDIAAEEVVAEVWNDSGATIFKCSAVYLSGFNVPNDLATIAVADADDAAKMPAVGLVRADIANGAAGFLVAAGDLINADTAVTETWSANDAVYVNASGTSTSGDCADSLTSTKPTGESSQIQKMGIVSRVNAANGEIEIVGAGRSNDVPNLDSAAIFVGTSGNAAAAVDMSGDVTISNTGVTTVADDSHAHIITDVDSFTVAELQTQTSDVTTFYTEDTVVPIVDGGTGASTLADLIGAAELSSTAIQAGDYPAAGIDGDDINSNLAGKGLDWTAGSPDQLDAAPVRVCKTLFDTGNLSATDDVPDLWSFNAASTVVDIDCISTGGTSITVTIEDDAGNDLVTSCACTTSWVDCGTVSNAAMTTDERIDWTTVSVSGSVTSATVCVDHDID